jgi:hypothetical protein
MSKDEIIALNPEAHRFHGWQRYQSYAYTAKASMVPVAIAELQHLLPLYTLAFRKSSAEQYQLVAVLGFEPQDNLYVNADGRWKLPYVPAVFRSYPYVMAKHKVAEEERNVLCFNKSSGLYRELPDELAGEMRFFQDDGSLAPHMLKLVKFLEQMTHFQQVTQNAVNVLAEEGLLAEWTFIKKDQEKQLRPMQTLFRIDQQALAQIPADTLKRLQTSNALTIAYAQSFSMARLGVLEQLHNARHSQAQSQQSAQDFFMTDGDDLGFDFSGA